MAASTTAVDLSRYPRPNVAIDVAVLTAVPATDGSDLGSLQVLVLPSPVGRGWVLPGRFLREEQRIAECVADALRVKAGLSGFDSEPRLLRVFDEPGRDPRGWTLSIGHSLALPHARLAGAEGRLVPVNTKGQLPRSIPLDFDHDVIVPEAAAAMRRRYEVSPDPDGLLEGTFTMTGLRLVHEAVLGERLLRDTFRRRMEPGLVPLTDSRGERVMRSDGGRPAQVYARGDAVDSPAAIERLRLRRVRQGRR